MADLPYIQQRQEVSITGQDSTGDQVNFVSADSNGNMLVKDYSDGVSGSTLPPVSTQIAGTDGTNLRTVATDNLGRVKLAASSHFHPIYSARVQSATALNSVLTTSVTATINPTNAGNTIIVAACCNAGTLSITDSASQSYSTATSIAGNGTQTSKIFYFSNTASGVTTVTISSTSSTDLNMIVTEYSGILASSPLDKTSTYGQTASTSWTSAPTATTTQASELLIGTCMGTLHNNSTFTAGSGWNSVATVLSTRGGANLELFMEDQNASVIGSYAATGTTNQNDNEYASIATFKFALPNSIVSLNSPYNIKSGLGILRRVVINSIGTGSANLTIYDNTTNSGNIIAILGLTSIVNSIDYNLNFNTGLTIVSNSSTADYTVVYD